MPRTKSQAFLEKKFKIFSAKLENRVFSAFFGYSILANFRQKIFSIRAF